MDYSGWEFSSLAMASNYYSWIFDTFSSSLHGRCLEIGSGAGNFTRFLMTSPSIGSLTCLEPSLPFSSILAGQLHGFPGASVIEATIEEYLSEPRDSGFDSIVSINVLEHVENDRAAVAGIADLLVPGGRFCLIVPAHPWLFGSLDTVFGHHRRYDRRSLDELVSTSALKAVDVGYMNSLGMLPWFVMGRILHLRRWNPGSVGLYDRWMIPMLRRIERRFRPPAGQSLYAILERPL
jgi:SAM-dependent methyltransferase